MSTEATEATAATARRSEPLAVLEESAVQEV